MSFQTLKPWLSYQDQLNLLKTRKLIIDNESRALHYLESLGYYRLSGYFYPFRQIDSPTTPIIRKDDFITNTYFEDVLNLYMFDKQLRILAFDALERIEMAIRVDIAYVLGRRHANAHEQENCLDASFCTRFDPKSGMKEAEHHQWLKKYDSLVQRAKKQDFIKHNLKKYGRLPVWVACEILDFGALSRLYSGMRYKDRQKIADKYIVTPDVLSQWLRSLNFIRNVVAHHSRLWNANIVERSDFVKSFLGVPLAQSLEKHNHKPFGYFYIMAHLLKVISPTSTWKDRLKQHIETQFPHPKNNAIKIEDFGYLKDFQQKNW